MNQEFKDKGYIVAENIIPHFIIEDLKDFWLDCNIEYDTGAEDINFVHKSSQQDVNEFQLVQYLSDFIVPRIEAQVGLPLIPTYNQGRMYHKGATMSGHVDRLPCDVSITFTVANEGENWPIRLIDKTGEPKSISTKIGDCLIYSGCEVQHWRDKNPNDLQVQHFFHFYSPHSRAGSFIEQMDDSYKGWNGFLANEIWPGNLELMQKHNITPLPRRQDV